MKIPAQKTIMALNFESTASALCYSIIHQRSQSTTLEIPFSHNKVVCFVLQQHSNMPDFFRLPIIILTLIFDLWGLLRRGTLFHRLPHESRWHQIQGWKNSPISVCRDLIRFYESLTIFSWYSNISGQFTFPREAK